MSTEHAYPKTLVEAVRYFSNPDNALNFFVKIRWPHGVTCPQCGSQSVAFLVNQRRWQCRTKHPKRQFSAKVGTIFEESPLPLEHWLVAVWLEVNAKNSISSYELARAIGITQKSAWFMLHRVRLALNSGDIGKIGGAGSEGIEADETLVGGLAKNMHKSRRARVVGNSTGGAQMTPVLGLLERHSEKGKSKVRCIKGTHVSIEPFHLSAYVDSEAIRFNNCAVKNGDRFLMALPGAIGKRMTYKQLIRGIDTEDRIAASDNGAASAGSDLPN